MGHTKLVRATASVLAAGVLAGCGARPDQAEQPPAGLRPGSAVPSGTTIAVEPRALPVLTERRPGQVSMPWTLSRVEGDRVVLAVSGSGCLLPAGAAVRETAEAVTITVLGDRFGEPCTAERMTLVGYVTTATPVGRRAVRSGE